jgi:amino-acid N-acetyltransferase
MPANDDDRDELHTLLTSAGLPLDGLDDAFPRGFVLARIGGVLVGAAGIEAWGPHALLRSVAVAASHRKQHIGEALVADRLAWAKAQSLTSVVLLTLDADRYFERLGFQRIARDELPAELQRSTQLQIPRCSTAVSMIRRFR